MPFYNVSIAFFMLLFFIANKTNDQKIFTKYFKLFDKSLASALSLDLEKSISASNTFLMLVRADHQTFYV